MTAATREGVSVEERVADVPSATGPAEVGARRFLVLCTAGLRLSYLVTGLASPVFGGPGLYRHLGMDLALLAAVTVWSVFLFRTALSTTGPDWLPGTAVLADAGLAVALIVAVTWLCAPVERLSWGNWAFPYALSAATLAAVRLPSWAAAAITGVLLAAFLGAELSFGLDAAGRTNLAGNAAAIPWFAAIAGSAWRYLRRSARRLDEATARVLRAESARAAEQARAAERGSQYRRLHDTVLSTLTMIARGGLDHRDDLVRARCAQDADMLRRLLGRGVEAEGELADALARIADRMEAVGLRTHLRCDLAGVRVPDGVAEGLALAVQEALNNVRLHAGVTQAWVTATGEEDRLAIQVVDRGCGIPAGGSRRFGTGIQASILGRLTGLGGSASVDSVPGEGTLVELVWPA